MDVYDAMLTRRSIRHFTPEPVTREEVTRLLEAAMAAPSARNVQPWEFVVVTDGAILDSFRAEFSNVAYNAPMGIVVCGRCDSNVARMYWVADCSLASGNILNAAVGMGLGAIWCAIYPRELRMAHVQQALALPENVLPLNIILVGHPDEAPEPRTQYDETKVYWDRYGK